MGTIQIACYTGEATAAGGSCDRDLFISTRGHITDGLFYDDGTFLLLLSFSEHGPKDKRKGELWRLRELHQTHS